MSGTDEQWKPLNGDETLGMISNHGRVKSVHGTILKQKITNRGYKSVHIMQRGRGLSKHYLVHRLVAKAFCQGYSEELTVNHKNGDKINNFAKNLEWISQKENVIHAFRTGLRKIIGRKPTIPLGDKEMLLLERASGAKVKDLAARYGVHWTSMSNYLNGRTNHSVNLKVAV